MAVKYSLLFNEFWRVWPKARKTGKAAAFKVWERDNLDENADEIINAVRGRDEKDPQWKRNGGQFIPMPSTYLNQERWNDEWESDREVSKKRTSGFVSKETKINPGVDLPPFRAYFNRVLFAYLRNRIGITGINVSPDKVETIVRIKNQSADLWEEETRAAANPDELNGKEYLYSVYRSWDAVIGYKAETY